MHFLMEKKGKYLERVRTVSRGRDVNVNVNVRDKQKERERKRERAQVKACTIYIGTLVHDMLNVEVSFLSGKTIWFQTDEI